MPFIDIKVIEGVFTPAEKRELVERVSEAVIAVEGEALRPLHLAKHARTVTLLVRGDNVAKSMSSYLVRAIESTPNIFIRLRTEVIDAAGQETLESIVLIDRANGTVEDVSANALFIVIGGEPHTEWLPDEIARDKGGYIVTGRDVVEQSEVAWEFDREPLTLETSMPGVFAAGDVRQGSIKRVASAVGDGATVIRLVHEHLRARTAELAQVMSSQTA
jgi:thioredoxin reductase (NADPH)